MVSSNKHQLLSLVLYLSATNISVSFLLALIDQTQMGDLAESFIFSPLLGSLIYSTAINKVYILLFVFFSLQPLLTRHMLHI